MSKSRVTLFDQAIFGPHLSPKLHSHAKHYDEREFAPMGPTWGHANHEGDGGLKELNETYRCAKYQCY